MHKKRLKITKGLVDRLQSNQMVWDTDVRGFGVRRQVHDKTFILKCSHAGKRRFFTIGKFGSPWTVEQARKKALLLLGSLHAGIDPAQVNASQQSTESTVHELCEKYLVEHADKHKKPSSAHSDRKNIENHVLPLLGKLVASTVTKQDVEKFRDSVRNGVTAAPDPTAQRRANRGGRVVVGGSGVANRCLTLLSKMFNLAEEWGVRPANSNPVKRVIHFKEKMRQRYLSSEELGRIGEAMVSLEERQAIDPIAAAALRVLMYSGARSGEILSLQWDFVDFDRKFLLLPDSKTGQKVIRLSEPTLQVLRSIKRIEENPFVFPGRNQRKHIVNIQKTWKRICAVAKVHSVRVHDLRHTFASIAASQNLSLSTIGALLVHTSQQTTARYAHLQHDHICKANEQVANAVQNLLGARLNHSANALVQKDF